MSETVEIAGEGGKMETVDLGTAIDTIAADLAKGTNDADGNVEKAKQGTGATDAPVQGEKGTGAPAETEAGAEPVAEPEKGDSAAAAPAAAAAVRAPDTWTREAQASFAKLPPDLQAEVVKREGDYARGIAQYRQGADIGARFVKAVEPFMPAYQKAGADPWALIPAVLNAHAVMAWGKPEDRVQMFKILAQDAGIDLASLAKEGPEAAQTLNARLQQRINELESGVTRVASEVHGTRVAELEKVVTAFAQDPAHPHFESVAMDMKRLLDSGAARDLEEAYRIAVWTSPVLQAKELARHTAQARTKADEEAATKAAKAKKATAANVRSSESQSHAGRPLGSIDDTLAETLSVIRSRE